MKLGDLFVIDTHVLIWFAVKKTPKLSVSARKVLAKFREGEATLLVPSAVMIETWHLSASGVIDAQPSFRGWWQRIAGDNLVHLDQTYEDSLTARELDWSHGDVFDRLIVATALRMGCPLLTADQEISRWGGVEICW